MFFYGDLWANYKCASKKSAISYSKFDILVILSKFFSLILTDFLLPESVSGSGRPKWNVSGSVKLTSSLTAVSRSRLSFSSRRARSSSNFFLKIEQPFKFSRLNGLGCSKCQNYTFRVVLSCINFKYINWMLKSQISIYIYIYIHQAKCITCFLPVFVEPYSQTGSADSRSSSLVLQKNVFCYLEGRLKVYIFKTMQGTKVKPRTGYFSKRIYNKLMYVFIFNKIIGESTYVLRNL